MDALLFIAIPATDTLDENSQFIWFSPSEEANNTGYDTIANINTQFPETPCIAILPGQKVFATQSELRINNRKQLQQALRYDLEEQLAEEVDNLHFAYQKNQQKTLDIAVVDKVYLESLIHFFAEHNILLQQMITDTALLNHAPEEWLILQSQEQLLLKTPEASYALDTNNLFLSLESITTELPDSIPVYSCSDFNLETSLLNFDKHACDNYLIQLCQYYPKTKLLNLLQGPYQVKTAQSWRLILATGLAGMLLFTSLFSYQLYQNHQLQQQETSLDNKITQLYKKSFPKARRIINPISQMRSKLKVLQNNQVKNGDFIPLLAKLARILQQQKQVKITQFEYQKQTLQINVSIPSLAKLEGFKNSLIQQGLQAKVASINKEEERILAQLTITGEKS